MIKKRLIIVGILIIGSLYTMYSFGDEYQTTVSTLLSDIQKTNANKTDEEKRTNYQTYINKIEKMNNIDSKVKIALVKYLQTKTSELKQTNLNQGLGEITNIDKEKIRTTRVDRHNTERTNSNVTTYTYDQKLEQTATARAKHLSEINQSSHKRTSKDGYYNYEVIKNRFKDQGITFNSDGGTLFSESIGRGYNSCKKDDCTTETIQSIKKVFAFFMSEKNKKRQPHYNGIVSPLFTKIGIGIATNPTSKKIFVVTHYSVDF